MRRHVAALLVVCLVAGWPGSCAQAAAARPDPVLRVLVTIKPLHALVAAVMAGAGMPELLITGTRSPHTHALGPSERRRLAAADLIIRVDPKLETTLAKLLTRPALARKTMTLTAVPGLTLLAWPGMKRPGPGAIYPHVWDPHIWLDPANARLIGEHVARRLARLAPSRAALFAANARRLAQRLEELERRLARRLAPLRDRPYLVFHEAFRYFEHRFGLRAAGVVTPTPQIRPGARHLAALRRLIEVRGVRCIFIEPQFSPRLARALVRGTKARLTTLDPLGADLAPGPTLYPRLLEDIANSFAACLGSGNR